jgi:tRNA(His) 5'-end guanylyltransferase
VAIGNFNDTSDLVTSARWGRTFLEASPRRTRAEFAGMAASDVYELLYGQFVVDITRFVEVPRRKPHARRVWDSDP